MVGFRSIDVERATITIGKNTRRVDIFYYTNCHNCQYSMYCGKSGSNCHICELFKQSRPGGDKGLCVCLNIPTAKEKELGKCKYFKPKEEQADGTESV